MTEGSWNISHGEVILAELVTANLIPNLIAVGYYDL